MDWSSKSEEIIKAFIKKYGYCKDFVIRLMTLSSLQELYNEDPKIFNSSSNERWINIMHDKGKSAGLIG